MLIRHTVPILGLSLALLCACASEQGGSQLTEQEVGAIADVHDAEVASDRDRVICRSEVTTGSRIPKRICRTQAQIEEEREAARELLERRRGGDDRPSDR